MTQRRYAEDAGKSWRKWEGHRLMQARADSTLVGLIGSSCSDEVVGGIKSITEAGGWSRSDAAVFAFATLFGAVAGLIVVVASL